MILIQVTDRHLDLNLGTEVSDNTSVSLNMIDSKANIMYDNPYPANEYANDLRQIGLGVTQQFSDTFKTNIDIIDQNISSPWKQI